MIIMTLPMQEGRYDDRPRSFLVYAPSRTAVVYALVNDDKKPPVSETKNDNKALVSETKNDVKPLVSKTKNDDKPRESIQG